jgi:hypothetical protein
MRRIFGSPGPRSRSGPDNSYKAAIAREKATRELSRWPKREDGNRLEPEAWPIIRPKFSLAEAKSIFTIGSCFARNIEEELQDRGYDIPTLSFAVPKEEWPARANGILNKYTPAGIWQELDWTARVLAASPRDQDAVLAEPLDALSDDLVIDLELAGLRAVSPARALERRRQLRDLNRRIFESDLVVVTPGVCEVWWDHQRQRHVEELPPRAFVRDQSRRFEWRMMDYETAYQRLERTADLIRTNGKPGVKMLFTVSPVPLKVTFSGQDVLIANTQAKATLRAALGALVARFDDIDYFPSFESVTLSRSTAVWTDDLRHVSPAFVSQVVGRLVEAYFRKPA